MVSISVDLEGGLAVVSIMTEQFLQRDDAGDGEGHLTGDESLAGDGGQGLERYTSDDTHSCEDAEKQVWQHFLACV